jgi:hypothetical protein
MSTGTYREPGTVRSGKAEFSTALAKIARRFSWNKLHTPVLTVGGLGCFCVAAFSWTFIAGMVVTGASLLILEWLGGDSA